MLRSQLDSLTTTPAATVRTSALHGEGIEELLGTVEQLLKERSVEVECRIPYSAGDVLAEIRKVGTVVDETYGPSGTQLVAFVPQSLRNKLQLAGFARKTDAPRLPKKSKSERRAAAEE